MSVLHECTHNICEHSVAKAYTTAIQESSKIKVGELAMIGSDRYFDSKFYGRCAK